MRKKKIFMEVVNDFHEDEYMDEQCAGVQNIASDACKNPLQMVAWKLYSKYYKRYNARMKSGNIPPEVFKQWQYKAQLCGSGEDVRGLRMFFFAI